MSQKMILPLERALGTVGKYSGRDLQSKVMRSKRLNKTQGYDVFPGLNGYGHSPLKMKMF